MFTVKQRVKHVKQPRGGYVNPRSMQVRQLEDGHPSPLDHKVENIHASLVGMAVDYLVRLATGTEPRVAFDISLRGARNISWEVLESAEAEVDALVAGRVDDAAIATACRLSGYDVAYRSLVDVYNPDVVTTPDALTIAHIAVMVERTLEFFGEYGPITLAGFTFTGAFTDVVGSGDGDFLTADTLWDLKVLVGDPTKDHTLQVLMYLLMGKRSGQAEFVGVHHLGVFNPRRNTVHRIALADIPADVLAEVSRDVIGYP